MKDFVDGNLADSVSLIVSVASVLCEQSQKQVSMLTAQAAGHVFESDTLPAGLKLS
ncbi:hypothetical protein O9992_22650 [Vibrio lentus]|nr:hypothetical protein [Vibrio lentus]